MNCTSHSFFLHSFFSCVYDLFTLSPVDRKMVINGLNSGANVYMADFEGMWYLV
jgi:hypothetical protein